MATATKEATNGATPKARKPRAAKAETAAKPKVDHRAAIRSAAQLLKHAGDPTRLSVLLMLAEGPKNVGEMCEELDQSQPACSHHLSLMRHAGLVEPTRSGKNNIYSNTEKGRRLCEAVAGLVL